MNGIHGLWGCTAAMDVWGESGSPVSKWSSNYADFEELWSDFIHSLDDESLNLVAVICYRIWIRRNELVFESKFRSHEQNLATAVTEIEVSQMLYQFSDLRDHYQKLEWIIGNLLQVLG